MEQLELRLQRREQELQSAFNEVKISAKMERARLETIHSQVIAINIRHV